MGQKVSPVGLRIGINKDWNAKWYAEGKDFAKYLETDIKIRDFLGKKLKKAHVSNVVIERNNKRTEVVISTARPGIIIGRSGEEVDKLKKALIKIVGGDVAVSIIEVKRPELDAQLVADNIAEQITNRVPFRIAQKRTLQNTMKAGAKGIKTMVSGRLNGAEIARTEHYTKGTVPLHTLRANIDYATSEAHTTYGIIGVKVWIYKGEILPTKKRNKEMGSNDSKESKGGNRNVDAKKN